MGGRGAASGVSEAGRKYGNEHKTLLQVDNIKFVEFNRGSATAPMETMSAAEDRVYAVVNRNGAVKSITYYNKEGKRTRQIDLEHEHDGTQPHVHIGYLHSEGQEDNEYDLSATDKKYVEKVRKVWASRK
ncbi:MAG: hypothetical protein LBJ64_02270 [Deltaproteobacteria bacterium]|jgi:hypothetical protein|nr:hypothetical protein [Deltaproteobacteria bacterium]